MEMMKVRNPNCAGVELTLRYTRDDDDNRLVVRGDSAGVFTVPVKDGRFLLKTKGWKSYKPAKPLPEEETGSDGSDTEVPDLDRLNKADLLAYAAKCVEEGYALEVDDTMIKADIKAAIADAVFSTDDDDKES